MAIQVKTDHLGLSNDLDYDHVGSRGRLLVGLCGNYALPCVNQWSGSIDRNEYTDTGARIRAGVAWHLI